MGQQTKPLPSQEKLKELFNYNPETGIFTWKVNIGRKIKSGQIAGSDKRYNVIKIDRSEYGSHRLAWMYMTGEDPGDLEVDHKDTDRLNNKWSNLRLATSAQNSHNTTKSVQSKTGCVGVDKKGNKYRARIRVNNTRIHLGYFQTLEEASDAYKKASQELHGEYSRTR